MDEMLALREEPNGDYKFAATIKHIKFKRQEERNRGSGQVHLPPFHLHVP